MLLFLIVLSAQSLDILSKTSIRRLKTGERRRRTPGFEKLHGSDFFGFPFCLTYPRLVVGQASNPETPMDTGKKIKCPQKTASSSQRAAQRNRTLLYIKHQLQQNIKEISTFMPISKGQVTSLYPHPCQTMPRHVPNLSSPQGSVVLDMSVDPTQMSHSLPDHQEVS